MVFAGFKKGDPCLVVTMEHHRNERVQHDAVKSVGRKWITVERGSGEAARFNVDRGFGSFGQRLHTKTTFAMSKRRFAALGAIHASSSGWGALTVFQLEAIATIIKAPGDSVQSHVEALREWCGTDAIGMGAYLDDLCRLLDILDPGGKLRTNDPIDTMVAAVRDSKWGGGSSVPDASDAISDPDVVKCSKCGTELAPWAAPKGATCQKCS